MHGIVIKTATVLCCVDHNHHLHCAKTINIVLIGNDAAPDNLNSICQQPTSVAVTYVMIPFYLLYLK